MLLLILAALMLPQDLNADLFRAVTAGDSEKVGELLQAGADPDARHPLTQWTPLHSAAYYGHVEVVRALLEAKADPNTVDRNNSTPLMKAVTFAPDPAEVNLKPKVEIVDLLLKAGADPQKRDKLGDTPWQHAMINNYTDLVDVFDHAGVKGVKEARLLVSIALRDREGVKALLDRGADPAYRDEDDFDALREALVSGDSDIVQLLLTAGADKDSRYSGGWTPLMLTAQQNQIQLVALLLNQGADPSATNDRGQTAADIAEQLGHTDILLLLKARAQD